MIPNTPILTLTLQIPVQPDTTVDKVLEAIAEQFGVALEEVREQQDMQDPEAIGQEEFNASLVDETEEAYTDRTKHDILASMGYKETI